MAGLGKARITIAPVAPIPISGHGPQSIAGYGPPAPTNFAIDFWVIEESILSSEIRSWWALCLGLQKKKREYISSLISFAVKLKSLTIFIYEYYNFLL
jgi:hypothetical protein